jgi:pilus assembly protein CpaC
VASATSVTPNEIMIHGLAVGSATLILWTDEGKERAMELEVGFDLPTLESTMSRLFPDETINVVPSGSSLVLSGVVSSEDVSTQALAVAETFAPGAVNLLQETVIDETILLQVRFAEVNRTALQELGVNLFSTGGANTIGSTGTQQFGQLTTNSGAVPADVGRGRDPQSPNLTSGGIGNPLEGTPSVFGLSDLMNIFLFRPDLNVGATIRALEQRNLLQILAEPNIMARNGVEARFLAGGEFPFPVVQATSGGNAISIVFKEFGVRLQFTPDVQPDGAIRLKVVPEVSALDFTNSLQISGFLIPALSTRRAETEVELRDGETFAIAGLIDQRTRESASKVPILGDIPIIGSLFRSRGERQDSTELLVMVTPRRVQPTAPGAVPEGPRFPEPFLNNETFDGNAGEAPPAQ